jgi:predicted helicase
MVLSELGYKPSAQPPRLSVYLTNSLEEGEPANQTLPFAQWLSNEVKEAHAIKRDMPIMCVIGNPPYSGHSSNKGAWIKNLLKDYKTSPELKKPAQAKWLSDDYVKFIRFAEHMISKNGYGVLGFITNNSYLDNPTFLDMRKHLMKTFDSIYVFDLHGSAKKVEVSPNGDEDQNVFDIQQGVSIIIAAKKEQPSKAQDARVFHADVWGSRESKYDWLWNTSLGVADKTEITPTIPPWLFTPQNHEELAGYQEFPSVSDWFSPYGRPAPGAVSTQDQFAVSWSKDEVARKIQLLLGSSSEEHARQHFRLCTQKQWHYEKAKLHLAAVDWSQDVTEIDYRLFDRRFTVNDSHVFVHRRERMNHHMFSGENIGLVTCRQTVTPRWNHVFVGSRMIDDCFLSNKTKERTYCFPLYLEPQETSLHQERETNIDPKLFERITELAQGAAYAKPGEHDVFDYIYGVMHCPAYREKYQDLLKRDFPRIPWPKGPKEFWETSEKGGHLRRLHLMDPAAIGDAHYPFRGEGNAEVTKPAFKDGKVWINKTQYFDEVPEVAWAFPIGGYQPAKKWLKDRKGRQLSFDDITHYQKIIKVLSETDAIMKTIEFSA